MNEEKLHRAVVKKKVERRISKTQQKTLPFSSQDKHTDAWVEI